MNTSTYYGSLWAPVLTSGQSSPPLLGEDQVPPTFLSSCLMGVGEGAGKRCWEAEGKVCCLS